MAFTDELYQAASELWAAQLEHPFVRELADGSLDEERFSRWVRQDYRYLKEFSRVFAWATAKADDLEAMGWYAAVLDLTLNTEMDLHRQYAARFGISRTQLEAEPMWPTTQAYTDFLVRTAADGDMLELLAALLPCAWGYSTSDRCWRVRSGPMTSATSTGSSSTPPTSSPRPPTACAPSWTGSWSTPGRTSGSA